MEIKPLSVSEFQENFLITETARKHADYVAQIAVQLFVELRPIHHVTPEKLTHLLEIAGKIHNIGTLFGSKDYAVNSKDLVLLHTIKDLSLEENAAVALMILFHNSKVHTRYNALFMSLPRELQQRVLVGAAVLRIAQALDKTKTQPLSLVGIKITHKKAYIVVTTNKQTPKTVLHARKNIYEANKKADLWNSLFKHKPISVVTQEEIENYPWLSPSDTLLQSIGKIIEFYFSKLTFAEQQLLTNFTLQNIEYTLRIMYALRTALKFFKNELPQRQLAPVLKELNTIYHKLALLDDLLKIVNLLEEYEDDVSEDYLESYKKVLNDKRRELEEVRKMVLAYLSSEQYANLKEVLANLATELINIIPDAPEAAISNLYNKILSKTLSKLKRKSIASSHNIPRLVQKYKQILMIMEFFYQLLPDKLRLTYIHISSYLSNLQELMIYENKLMPDLFITLRQARRDEEMQRIAKMVRKVWRKIEQIRLQLTKASPQIAL